MSEHPQLEGVRVLVVEDDAPIMLALTTRLKREGLKPTPAPDGRTALQIAKSVNPAVAVIDINLPLLDGFEVARSLDELCGHRVAKVFITATRNAQTRHCALNIDDAVFLEKPFTSPYLLMRISEALTKTQPSAA